MAVVWAIIIGVIVGVIAKFLSPSPNNPQGFILTTVLGLVGSFVGTIIGLVLGFYRHGQGAGIIMSVVGAIIVLVIYRAWEQRHYPTNRPPV
jgi:uncharacterized membrane protein YeaQ/YmgE (transglycosylase-associated protein family)